ncbi:Gti1/Pac2 family-domain-containing protein, partial [Vararia minispora EC-137]
QPPTCSGMRIRTARDAEIIFHAVALRILPIVTRRLDSEERMALCSGCVYVWEERTSNVSESLDHGIERFTEGRSWGPSRARDDFLFYQEKDTAPKFQEDPIGSYSMRPRRQGERMIKQTYSVYINGHAGMKKWHLNAYYTQETLDQLHTVDDFPQLAALRVPDGLYICARTNRMR